MKYRRFGKVDWKVSTLGFGAMRLPTIGEDRRNIDEAKAIQMLRYAFDHGVNYIDTAYPYHGGNSEVLIGKVLKEGYSERVRLATKMPLFRINIQEDLDRIFNEQLSRLQTDHIDFYLLHGVRKNLWTKVQDLNVLKWAENKLAEGKIGYLGFSFHDEYEVFKEIIDSYDRWTFCQIQYNYLDSESSPRTPGMRGLKYAASKGLAVVVMEPIQGGNLAVNPPEEILTLWEEAEIKRTPAEWALQWVWNQSEVSLALSGMNTMDHVVENVRSANRSGSGTLTTEELKLISRIREQYFKHGFIGCTQCRYCVPCPNGVEIPEILALYNEFYVKSGDISGQQEIRTKYRETIPSEKGIEMCVRCGECEDKCPQQLPIRNLIARANRSFRMPRRPRSRR